MKNLILVINLIVAMQSGFGQNVRLLDSVASKQIQRKDFFDVGLFPSQITWRKGKKSSDDDNIFFTAITLYTLNSLRQHFSSDDQNIIDSLLRKSDGALKRYKNRKGDITYNFYQVHPENAFPGVKLISKFFHTKLPDDLDDTSLIYLIQQTSDSLNNALKKKMNLESLDGKKVKSTMESYRRGLAYRTWFADRMNQDLDVCVNANVLTFVFKKKLAPDSIDAESIRFIKSVIINNEHINCPQLVSPHYQNTSVILYHVARLIAVADNQELNSIRDKVIGDLRTRLSIADNEVEKIILLSSLHRLNQKDDFEISFKNLERDMEKFYWFRGNLTSGRPFWIRRLLGKSDFLNYKYSGEAYYWTLVLELEKLSGARFRIDKNQQISLYKTN